MNRLEEYISSLTNLYGLVSVKKVTEIYNQQNRNKINEDAVRFYSNGKSELLGKESIYFHQDYFVKEAIMIHNEFEEQLAIQNSKPFYVPKQDELLKYMRESNSEKNKQYRDLLKYVTTKIFAGDQQRSEDLCEDLLGICRFAFSMNMIMQSINNSGAVFENQAQMSELLDLIMALANNTRIWENNGHTPNELSELEKKTLRPLPKPPSGKIGRNERCPCGSGKKYKRCCIDKPARTTALASPEKVVTDLFSYEEVDQMSTELIIQRLRYMGITFNMETFLEDVARFYSAEQISEDWFTKFNINVTGREEDFPWFAARILWERLAPADVLSLEQMYDLIEKGYSLLDKGHYGEACDVWLNVWGAIKNKHQQQHKTLDFLDKQYKGTFFIRNIVQDLEINLHNAGLEDQSYFEKRIKFCEEFVARFPDESELMVHNMRRAIGESYASLGNYKQVDLEFGRLVKDDPLNPWGYIGWGDAYMHNDRKDLARAKTLYEKGLAIAKDKDDVITLQERIKDLISIA